MVLLRSILAILLLAGAAEPAVPQWRQAREYEVLLSSFDIAPSEIRLAAGQPVRLRLVNQSNQTHSFSARDFFGAAQLRPRDAELAERGKVLVGPGRSRTIYLVPSAGRFGFASGNILHRILGMGGRIVVE